MPFIRTIKITDQSRRNQWRLFFLLWGAILQSHAAPLPATIAKVKPSVVGIGTYDRTRSPAITFIGTGFVSGDGLDVITNAHVVLAAESGVEQRAIGIVTGVGETLSFRPAAATSVDVEHDLARIRLAGKPLPALTLDTTDDVSEGSAIAFTGFPLGMVLGLHHVTHRGVISAITPIVAPSMDSKRLDPKAVAQLRRASFDVLQLDATAYPGNSGSPVYDPETGIVYGVINMVFVKGLKETAITNPSGVTYAIPVRYVRQLIEKRLP
jgi:S1-C subfamily serine protease